MGLLDEIVAEIERLLGIGVRKGATGNVQPPLPTAAPPAAPPATVQPPSIFAPPAAPPSSSSPLSTITTIAGDAKTIAGAATAVAGAVNGLLGAGTGEAVATAATTAGSDAAVTGASAAGLDAASSSAAGGAAAAGAVAAAGAFTVVAGVGVLGVAVVTGLLNNPADDQWFAEENADNDFNPSVVKVVDPYTGKTETFGGYTGKPPNLVEDGPGGAAPLPGSRPTNSPAQPLGSNGVAPQPAPMAPPPPVKTVPVVTGIVNLPRTTPAPKKGIVAK